MNKPKITLGFLAWLSLVVLASPSSAAVDLTGTWTGSTVLNNGQGATLELTLVLNKAGQSYSGTINGSLGLIDKDSAIADVKLAGNEFSFSFKGLGGALDLAGSFTVTGDKMTGKLEDRTNGNDTPFEFARRK